MDFQPFSQSYVFDPNVLIEDFPEYLLPHIINWVRAVMRTSDIGQSNNISSSFKREIEFRIRRTVPSQVVSFIASWVSSVEGTCDLLTLMLQNYASEAQVVQLKELLRVNSSAYTAEPTGSTGHIEGLGGYRLVRRVPEAVRQQAEPALSANDLMLNAWNECYKMPPDYTEAVRLANDFMEGLLRDKFWSGRTRPYTVGQVVAKFTQDDSGLHFKAESFLTDKTKVIGLLQGVANIRGEHTTGEGRNPTADEAEFVVQTSIYLYTLLEPIAPTNLAS
ncbi:MAG: hypothetical protein WDN66_02960 [Candidatus Saccharibacteria bacterium]